MWLFNRRSQEQCEREDRALRARLKPGQTENYLYVFARTLRDCTGPCRFRPSGTTFTGFLFSRAGDFRDVARSSPCECSPRSEFFPHRPETPFARPWERWLFAFNILWRTFSVFATADIWYGNRRNRSRFTSLAAEWAHGEVVTRQCCCAAIFFIPFSRYCSGDVKRNQAVLPKNCQCWLIACAPGSSLS